MEVVVEVVAINQAVDEEEGVRVEGVDVDGEKAETVEMILVIEEIVTIIIETAITIKIRTCPK